MEQCDPQDHAAVGGRGQGLPLTLSCRHLGVRRVLQKPLHSSPVCREWKSLPLPASQSQSKSGVQAVFSFSLCIRDLWEGFCRAPHKPRSLVLQCISKRKPLSHQRCDLGDRVSPFPLHHMDLSPKDLLYLHPQKSSIWRIASAAKGDF